MFTCPIDNQPMTYSFSAYTDAAGHVIFTDTAEEQAMFEHTEARKTYGPGYAGIVANAQIEHPALDWECSWTTGGRDPELADGCDQAATHLNTEDGKYYCADHMNPDANHVAIPVNVI